MAGRRRLGLFGAAAVAGLGSGLAERKFGPLPERLTLIFDGS